MPYWQGLDESTEDSLKADLALPLAKALIEQHDGHFDLVIGEGPGTIARIRLPASRVRRPG